MSKEKVCQYCHKLYSAGTSKAACYSCYGLIKKYGTANPDHHNRKCIQCGKDYHSKSWKQKFCCKGCYRISHSHKTFIEYRIKYGIDLSIPKKPKAPNGSGHKEPHGYIYITKMRHPNATKSGRIYEHTYVMSQHIGRPLMKNENVHHKNGIRDDNRIENLELWNKGQPAGQRVEDKIKWCKEFLAQYGIKVID